MRASSLLRKDLSELFAGRAFWLLLLILGLLVGQSFITAVNAYAETAAALPQALSPLDGILVPVMGAYDLAIMLLFPFVAIRLVATEKSSGALKLMLQWPFSMRAQLASKCVALLVAWIVSLLPLCIALVMWLAYGGHLDTRETLNLIAGYTLRFILTASVAVAAAAVMPGAANAAVVVLGLTIGTWVLDFLATGRGGIIQRLASFTPTATLRTFERGLLRVDVVAILLLLSLLFFTIAGIALRLGSPMRTRILRSAFAFLVILVFIAVAAQLHTSFDLSENRRNSFSPSEERTLASIREPLTITVFLAAEDPRMNDFENHVLIKLRRAMQVRVRYPFAGSSALFENHDRYGEIHYQLGPRRAMSRSTTEEIVIDTIAALARRPPPAHEPSSYPGYPLAKRPRGAALVFYAGWPLALLIARRLGSPRTG